MTTGRRIVITRPLPGDPIGQLRARGYQDVWINPEDRPLTRNELLEAVRGAHALLATPADTDVNAELFDAAGEQLVIVSNYAVGVDNCDLEEAARRNILIGHTPHAVTEPTADIAWLLLLAAARRATEATDLLRSGVWTGVAPLQLLGQRIVGRTLFIIGAGRIGLATARRSIGWDMNVLYHARTQHPEFEAPPIEATRVTLDEGLQRADFVSLHTPLTPQTHQLIGERELALMPAHAVLINTARGQVVDESALVEALREGRIFAAGLDVYENEPHPHPALRELPNAFLLPHLGSATVDDRRWMMQIAIDNIDAAFKGHQPPHLFPSGY